MRGAWLAIVTCGLVASGCDNASPVGPIEAGVPGNDGEPAEAEAASAMDSSPGYAVCPDPMDATYGSIFVGMLSAPSTCGSQGVVCHSTVGASHTGNHLDLSLDAAAVFLELLGPDGGGAPSANTLGDAGREVLRVAPGDSGASMLVIKLILMTSDDPEYGGGMPAYAPGSVCPAA